MGSQIQLFTNDAFGQVRTLEDANQVWFCGKDVAKALGYSNTKDALGRHCRGVVKRYPISDSLGRTQQARFISEPDLYRLIASSKLPAAVRFEAWIFGEVVPSIRRHGIYAIDELLASDEFLERALSQLRTERARRLAAEQALLEAAPKASYYDLVLASPDAVPVTLIAKDYGMSAKRLNALLYELGVQFKQSGTWVLYQKHAGNGYTDSKTHIFNEGRHSRIHTYWTQKGRLFIYETLKENGVLPTIEREVG